MYQIGDKVVYGVHGICQVTAQERRCADGKNLAYLALEPLGQEGTRYLVPTHNAAAMAKLRPVLSREKAQELLQLDAPPKEEWISDEGRRKQVFRELITSGDCQRILGMVHMLYYHKAAQAAAGRKLHMCDENFLRDAERLIAGEVAIVLERTPEEVRQQLRQHLAEKIG